MQVCLDPIERAILEKFYRHGYIGGRHTVEENVQKGFPSHLRGELKHALKRLIREGYIVPKITSYGRHISFNPSRIKEIESLITSQEIEVPL